MIFSYKGFIPVIHPTAFVHPLANVMGNVVIGANVFIGSGAALRGDIGGIIIKDGCNVQENCTIHMFPGKTVVLEENCHIGHGAIIHGSTLGYNVMVGMNAVVMDDVYVGENTIIGALAFVKANEVIPARSLVVGNPAKVIKTLTDEMIDWKSKGTALYQSFPEDYRQNMQECEPLTEMPADRPSQEQLFETWNSIKNKR